MVRFHSHENYSGDLRSDETSLEIIGSSKALGTHFVSGDMNLARKALTRAARRGDAPFRNDQRLPSEH
jgi:hypothetical protein